MPKAGEKGSVVTLMCDGGDRYIDTYFNPDWESALDDFDRTGVFEPDLQVAQLRKL